MRLSPLFSLDKSARRRANHTLPGREGIVNKPTRDDVYLSLMDVYLSLMGELDGRLFVMQSKENKGQLTRNEYELFLILPNLRALIPVLYVTDK